jgi:hypothetical protein
MAELTITVYPRAFTCNSFTFIAFGTDLRLFSGQHLLTYGPLVWAVPYFFYAVRAEVT